MLMVKAQYSIPLFGVLLLSASMGSPACFAENRGLYAGRALLSGQAAVQFGDAEAGTEPLAERGARIAGDRLFVGYRFGSGLAVEGTDLRMPAHQMEGTTDSIGIAGAVSLPINDKFVATAKAGFHLGPEQAVNSVGKPATSERLYGASVAYRATRNLELVAKTERF